MKGVETTPGQGLEILLHGTTVLHVEHPNPTLGVAALPEHEQGLQLHAFLNHKGLPLYGGKVGEVHWEYCSKRGKNVRRLPPSPLATDILRSFEEQLGLLEEPHQLAVEFQHLPLRYELALLNLHDRQKELDLTLRIANDYREDGHLRLRHEYRFDGLTVRGRAVKPIDLRQEDENVWIMNRGQSMALLGRYIKDVARTLSERKMRNYRISIDPRLEMHEHKLFLVEKRKGEDIPLVQREGSGRIAYLNNSVRQASGG